MKTILVADDFSERSDRVLRRAALLADQMRAEIVVLHVVEHDGSNAAGQREAAERLLKGRVAMVKEVDGRQARYTVSSGAPVVSSILRILADYEPELLVLGGSGQETSGGTVAAPIIQACSVPVLITNAHPSTNYRHPLLTTDLSDQSRQAMERFYALGMSEIAPSTLYVFEAVALRLMLVHTLPEEEGERYAEEEILDAKRHLAGFMEDAGLPHSPMLVKYEARSVAEEIVKAALDVSADLIVLGKHRQPRIGTSSSGRVLDEVLHKSDRDVLVIPVRQADALPPSALARGADS